MGSTDTELGIALRAAHEHRASVTSRQAVWVLLFDVDEHTGHFGGAQAYFEGVGAVAVGLLLREQAVGIGAVMRPLGCMARARWQEEDLGGMIGACRWRTGGSRW